MQNVISPSIQYNVSDRMTWTVYKNSVAQNATTLDLTVEPSSLSINVVSGILKPLSSQSKLILEQSLGIELTDDVYKIFLRSTNFDFKALQHLVKMVSHTTNYGREMTIVTNYFRVLSTSRRLDSENWITIYKLN